MEPMQKIKIFSDIPGEVYRQIEAKIRWKKYEPNVEVILYNEESTEVYFIREGHVRATMFSYSGKEVSYQDLFAGDIFGELSA